MLDPCEIGLEANALVLVDSGPLIYYLEAEFGAGSGKTRRARLVGDFLKAAREGKLRLAVSVMAWTEVLASPLASGDEIKASSFRNFLADSKLMKLEPVDVAIAEETSRLMASPRGSRTKGPGLADAIHLATALVAGASAVLTNDEAWTDFLATEKQGRRLPRVLLLDELAFDPD